MEFSSGDSKGNNSWHWRLPTAQTFSIYTKGKRPSLWQPFDKQTTVAFLLLF
jgi:hypothetical protein